MKRPKKRTLLMVLLLLTYSGGGAIINVAVAWGCAAGFESLPRLSDGVPSHPIEIWHRYAPTNWPQANITGFRETGWLGYSLTTVGLYENWGTSSGKYWVVYEARSGFPLLCLRGAVTRHGPPTAEVIQQMLMKFEPGLPYGPLWLSFAINTIFYAAILWLLFAAPGFVKRRIRTKRGQCPACAYPIGASEVCTECGGVVRIQKP